MLSYHYSQLIAVFFTIATNGMLCAQQTTFETPISQNRLDLRIESKTKLQLSEKKIGQVTETSNPILKAEHFQYRSQNFVLKPTFLERVHHSKVRFYAKAKKLNPKIYTIDFFKSKDKVNFAIQYLDISCGLPSNKITNIVEDNKGNIWFAFNGGVAQLSSTTIRIYDASSGFPDYPITSMVFHNNNLFIGTFGGGLIRIQNNTLYNYTIKNGFCTDLIEDIAVTKKGIYLGTYGKGLLYLDNKMQCSYVHSEHLSDNDNRIIHAVNYLNGKLALTMGKGYAILENEQISIYTERNNLPPNEYSKISILASGQVLLSSENHFLFRVRNDQLIEYRDPKNLGLQLNALFISPSGNIWIATDGAGMFKVNEHDFVRIDASNGLTDDFPISIFKDSYDNLWVGSKNEGVNLISPSNFTGISSTEKSINALATADNNSIVYEHEFGGIIIKNTENERHLVHPVLREINGILFDQQQNCYWITSRKGLYKLVGKTLFQLTIENDGKPINTPMSISKDRKGNLWINDYNFGVFTIENGTPYYFPKWINLSNTLTYSSFQDKNGNTWICGDKGNVSCFSSNKISQYDLSLNGNQIKIYSGCEAETGVFYFGTNIGLLRFKNGVFKKINIRYIFKNEKIQSLFFEPLKKELWIGTQNGLVQFKNNKSIFFNESSGIPSGSFQLNCVATFQGNLIWATSKGLVEYTSFTFKNEKQVRKIQIQKINLPDKQTNWTKALKNNSVRFTSLKDNIPYGLELTEAVNGITLYYSCTNWGKEKESVFYYRLKNKSNKWLPFTTQGVLKLQNLQGGNYVLQVKAQLPQNNKSSISSYRFKVIEPFYKHLWFLLTVSLFIVLLFWFIVKKYSTFTFDQFSTLGNETAVVYRFRIIAYFILFISVAVVITHSEIGGYYRVDWPLNISFIVLVIAGILYSYLANRNIQTIRYLLYTIYIITLIIHLYRGAENYFPPSISIENSVLLLFAVFVFKDLKNVSLFALSYFVVATITVTWSEAELENKLLFGISFLQVLLAAIIFSRIEHKNLSKIVFSDKLLNRSEQFIIVSDLYGEIVYINEYTANYLGFKEHEALGEGWWKLRSWTPEQIAKAKLEVKESILQQKSSRYTNAFVNQETKQLIYIDWQDTAIEGKYLLGIGKDITKEVEQREELEKLSVVAKNVTNGIIITNDFDEIEWVNESYLQLMEFELEELIGKHPLEVFGGPNTDIQTGKDLYELELSTGFELLKYTKSGIPKWFLINITRVKSDNEVNNKKIHVILDITADKKLKEHHKYILENAGDMIYTTDINGMFDYVNSATLDVLGYEPYEILGKHFTELVYKDSKEEILAFYLDQLKNNISGTNKEFMVYTKSGAVKWISQKVTFVYNDKNEIIGFQAIVHDISLIKQIELEKAEATEQLNRYSKVLAKLSTRTVNAETTFDSLIYEACLEVAAAIGINRSSVWILNDENLICQANNANKTYSVNILKPANYPVYFNAIKNDLSLISTHPQNSDTLSEFHGLLEMNNVQSLIHVPIRSNGILAGVLCCESVGSPKNWTDQDIQFVKSIADLVSVNLESDKRYKAELIIQESEANFRMLNETIDDVFWLFDLEKRSIIYISPSCKKILGVSEQEFYETNNYWTKYILEEDKSIIIDAHKQIAVTGFYEIEYRIHNEKGVRWIYEKSFGIKDEQGNIVKSSGICSDITSRKNIEKQIKQLSVVAEKTRNPIVISNPSGEIEWVNSAFEELTLHKLTDIIGKRPGSFLQGEKSDLRTIKKIREGLRKRSSIKEEVLNYRKDGSMYWVELNIDPIFTENGELSNYIAVEQDITDRKNKEELIESQHLDIINSINYTKRIQNALLPSKQQLDLLNIDIALFNQPKDIIGGDFYWCEQKDEFIILAVGDCTGHGVPGALMTSLGINGLINAVSEQGMTNPSEILNYLDQYIFAMLDTSNPDEQVNDGMDIGIITLNTNTNQLFFAGAGRSLYTVDDAKSIHKHESSRRTIGTNMGHIPYVNSELQFMEGVSYHLFTDGLTDQFGGENNKRIGTRKFVQLLSDLNALPLSEMENELRSYLMDWKGTGEQTDDMIWMAIRKKNQ